MVFSPDYIPGRVSIIIISYNYGRFIAQAIESAIGQHIDDLEVIVVDDGSTDNTPEAIKPYRDRITYIFQDNAGQSAARNAGIEKSTGEFIQFLDSDDILGPGKINKQLDYFSSHQDAYITACESKLFEHRTPKGKVKITGSWYLFRDNLDLYLCYFNIAPPHAFLYRREVFIQTGRLDSSVDNCEDYDLLFRAAVRGYIPIYVPSCMVYYRRHKKSITANRERQFLVDARMHKRLSHMLDLNPNFPSGYRLEGLLAYCAGALTTAGRLYENHSEDTDRLLELALRQIVAAKDIAGRPGIFLNFPIRLFCLKIVSSLSLPCFKSNLQADIIRKKLFGTLESIRGPSTLSGLITKSLLYCLFKTNRLLPERLMIGYISLRYPLSLMYARARRSKF